MSSTQTRQPSTAMQHDSTPSSPELPASPGRFGSTVRFSSTHSTGPSLPASDSCPSFGSDSSSPVSGPSRPALQERQSSSRPVSGYSTALQYKRPISTQSTLNFRRPYPSTKLRGEVEKPWTKYPDPAHRWARVIFWVLVALGFAVGGVIVYLGIRSVPTPGNLCVTDTSIRIRAPPMPVPVKCACQANAVRCLVMNDDFSGGIDQFWSHEVRLDGFGNNQFEWTTASENNSFVQDGTLYIVPTLTEAHLGSEAITNGYTLNLTVDGTCTSSNVSQCAVVSNSSLGNIINPVMSARMTTKNKASIKYGKVEVEARMPTGDWLWPAIWMMPTNDTYGTWPKSGEIDIAESRGNNNTYGQLGNDFIFSALHWGPVPQLDSYRKTWGTRWDRATGYAGTFHKYTLEWTDKYLTTYIDNKVWSIMDIRFDKSFWDKGKYPTYFQNGTVAERVTNPWYTSDEDAAPFDQDFYLILNVAVGGTNGWFPDNLGSKPWLDSSQSAMTDFWAAKDKWYPSWPADPTQRGMAVKSVKMWQKC